MTTFEVYKLSSAHFLHLYGFRGAKLERLDPSHTNVSVHDEDVDALTEFLTDHEYDYRMV